MDDGRRGATRLRTTPLILALGATLWCAAPTARAGGLEIPTQGARAVGRGGAFAVAPSDLTALHFNPSALALLGGTRVLYHHNLVFHDVRFTRAPLDAGWGDLGGTSFAPVSDDASPFPRAAFVALSSDFGLDGWAFAVGVYGPSGLARRRYPDYGPQSFQMTAMDVAVHHWSLAVAWRPLPELAVGVTLQWVDAARLDYSLVTDATNTAALAPVPEPGGTQLRATLRMEDRVGATAVVGVWWRPLATLELGLAGRVVPVPLALRGDVAVDRPTLVTEDITVATDVTLPVQLRGGVRYAHPDGDGGERFDVELDVVWENWSVVERTDLDFEGAISGQRVQDLTVARAWRDTVSIRLGGDVAVVPGHVTLRAGGYWERGAVPTDYAHLDFPSFRRFGVGGGVTLTWYGVALTVGYLHVFQEGRTVSERHGKVFQQRALQPCPDGCGGLSGVVANAGRFEASFDILAIGVDLELSRWWADAE